MIDNEALMGLQQVMKDLEELTHHIAVCGSLSHKLQPLTEDLWLLIAGKLPIPRGQTDLAIVNFLVDQLPEKVRLDFQGIPDDTPGSLLCADAFQRFAERPWTFTTARVFWRFSRAEWCLFKDHLLNISAELRRRAS